MCSKIWERDLIEEEIESLTSAFGDFAKVSCTHRVSIISLICNVAKTSRILERVRAPILPYDGVILSLCSQLCSPCWGSHASHTESAWMLARNMVYCSIAEHVKGRRRPCSSILRHAASAHHGR